MNCRHPLIIVWFLMASFSSCAKKELSYNEYVTYIEDADHGLVKSDSVDGVLYQVSYRPTSVMVYQSLKNEEINRNTMDSLTHVYSGYEYFLLRISSGKKELLSRTNRQDFSRIIQDISFHMQDIVYVIEEHNDTSYLVDFIAPRFYGLSDATPILLAFKKRKTEPEYFRVHVKGLFGGSVDLKFKNENLTDLPLLKFDL